MNLFSFIKSKVSIIDVVNEYTTLRRAGLYWKAHCPFHNEKSASFTVSPHKEIFYCFGCHASGDCIAFISRIENCSQLEAAKLLADRFSVELPQDIKFESTETNKKREHYFTICQVVAIWCHEQLRKYAHARNYVESRSISTENIDRFKVGYFPGGLHAVKDFIRAMQAQNIMVSDLLDAKILQEGQRILFSPFEERILFPIRDHLGRYCGFGGRTYKTEDERPKYYNSKESEHFSKGNLLFGLDCAKKHIQGKEEVFLVEGYTDCLAMVDAGYTNTVATLGTACTIEHLKQLARYAKTMYVLYDGDNAGQNAVLRLADLGWQVSLELRVATLPSADDPASFLIRGGDLGLCIEQAQDVFEFFISSLSSDFSTKPLQDKMRIAKKIIGIVQKIDDPLKRDLILHDAANRLNVPFDTLKMQLSSPVSHSGRAVAQDAPEKIDTSEKMSDEKISTLEKRIFFAIINNIKFFNGETEEVLIAYFSEPLRAILIALQDAKKENAMLNYPQFFEMLNVEQQHIIAKIALEQEDQISAEDFSVLYAQFRKRSWKSAAHAISLQIEEAKRADSPETVRQLLNEFMELKRRMLQKNSV